MLSRAKFPHGKKLYINCHRQGQAWREQPEPVSAPAFDPPPSLDAPRSVSSSRSSRPRVGAYLSQQAVDAHRRRVPRRFQLRINSCSRITRRAHGGAGKEQLSAAPTIPPLHHRMCARGLHAHGGLLWETLWSSLWGNIMCMSICRVRCKPCCSLHESFTAPNTQLCANSAVLVHWPAAPCFQEGQVKS